MKNASYLAATVLTLLGVAVWSQRAESDASEPQLSLVAEIELPRGPWNLLVDEARNQVYVAQKANRFAIMDGSTNLIVLDDRPDLDRPRGLALDDAGGRVYLNSSGSNGLAVYDADSGARVATIDSDNNEARIVFDEVRRRIYVAGVGGIEILDPDGNLISADESLNFRDVAFDSASGRLFSIREDSDNFPFGVELNPDDGSVIRDFGVAFVSLTVNADLGIVYGSDEDSLSLFEEATNQLTKAEPSVPYDSFSVWDMTVDESTGCIYAVERFFEGTSADGEIFVLSAAGEMLARSPVARDLWSVEVNASTGMVYVADATFQGRVLVYETFNQPELCNPSAESAPPTPSPSPSQPPVPTPAALPNTGGRQ